MNKIYLSEFNGKNDTEKLQKAINFLKENDESLLKIEPGTYIIESPEAKQLQINIMQGKYTNNPEPQIFNKDFKYSIGLDFKDVKNAIVDAYGVTFLVDGFMETISLQYCENITIKGLTIDSLRKPYSKGNIVGFGENYTDINFKNLSLISPDMPSSRIVMYNKTERRFTSLYSSDKKEQLSKNTIRFFGFSHTSLDDEGYVIHTFHYRPAILIYEAKNTVLQDVTIHSHAGMGVVGHRSNNILLNRLKVVPAIGEGASTNTDATHFTSCTGTLRIEGCQFDGHGDDAINVHTYYQTIISHNKNKCSIMVKAPTGTHAQKLDYPDIGDTLEFSSPEDLTPINFYKVLSVTPNVKEWKCEIILDKALPANCDGYYLANATKLPRLEFINCYCRNHLARSVLVKTRNVLIEGCSFESCTGTAIHVAAEGYWHEGITAENVVIKNNRIMFCGKNGHGCILHSGGISINILAPNATLPVHKNILIENNIIDCPDTKHAIYAKNIDGLTIKYNELKSQEESVKIVYCTHVKYDENHIST